MASVSDNFCKPFTGDLGPAWVNDPPGVEIKSNRTPPIENNADELVLTLSIKKISEAFDEFIGACIDAEGRPKAPDYKSLMKARGYLPTYCKHALAKSKPTGKDS